MGLEVLAQDFLLAGPVPGSLACNVFVVIVERSWWGLTCAWFEKGCAAIPTLKIDLVVVEKGREKRKKDETPGQGK